MAKNISDNCEFELCGICQKEDSKKKWFLEFIVRKKYITQRLENYMR